MAGTPRIAIDAMGGDGGPATMIEGAALAATRDQALRFTLFGDESLIRAELVKHPALADRVDVAYYPCRGTVPDISFRRTG